MVQYATPTELAGALQKDLDTYSATQAIERASEQFSARANMRWAATAGTYTLPAPTFATSVLIPARNVTAITAVKVNGVAVAVDYTLRRNRVYRLAGFGNPYAWPPDEVTVEYTYGLTTVPKDVWDAVLSLAGDIYEHPDPGVASESIDDFRVTFYAGTPVALSGRRWTEVADRYAGLLVA